MEDSRIIDLYWQRSESAIDETAKKYSRYCHSISFNILHSAQDAEECVNDTYLNAWNAMPPRRPNCLATFLGRITRNLSLDRFKRYSAEKRGGGQTELALAELDEAVPAAGVEEAVRTALEGQVGSEYMVSIQVKSAAVDPEETDRVREQLIIRGTAQRQGWSEEYLAEHFAVVKAFYCAEYDRERTTRGIHRDDVIEYFYLVQDADSGLWSVIDRSGSTDSKWGYSAPVPLSWQEQIKTYLSDLFTRAYSPYYDGLHYEMRHYEETVEDGVCTATFLWTMYNLAKGWDVASDEGKEEMGNYLLQATAAVDDSGMLDMSTISVMMDVAVTGPSKYSFPIEKIFPTQLAD